MSSLIFCWHGLFSVVVLSASLTSAPACTEYFWFEWQQGPTQLTSWVWTSSRRTFKKWYLCLGYEHFFGTLQLDSLHVTHSPGLGGCRRRDYQFLAFWPCLASLPKVPGWPGCTRAADTSHLAFRDNTAAASPHLCSPELPQRAVRWPPWHGWPMAWGQKQELEKAPFGILHICNQCCCVLCSIRGRCLMLRKDAWCCPVSRVFLPLPRTGNALLLAQRSFILTAETFIVPKELVQYNSPLCTAASPMSHMQSQGKAWMLRKALHGLSAQRYIQLKQCYFCLTFGHCQGRLRLRQWQGKCVRALQTLCLFTYKQVERGRSSLGSWCA